MGDAPKPKDKSLDTLHETLQHTKERLAEADEFINNMDDDGAKKVGLSITGASAEINMLLKQLFLCSINDMAEYEVLREELYRVMKNIHLIVGTQFGKMKAGTPPSTEKH